MAKYTNFKLYKAMNQFKADNFYINLLEEFQYSDIKELRKQEGQYIKIVKPELNKNIAGRSVKEYSEDNQRQINRAISLVVEQLNATYLTQLKEDSERFAWFNG